MTVSKPERRWSLWLEYGFVAAIIVGMAYAAWFFRENGYLPQPFFYEPSGVFMDWYSLTYWGHYRGAYEIAGTIYPPLSFVILKTFSFKSCYINNSSEWARSCDWLGIWALSAILVINVVLTFMAFYKHDRRTFFPRAFALSLGLPMIYTYERGNLLLFCYACVLLAFGPPLIRSARARWFLGGMALNFKVYLIGALLAPLLQRRWIQTEGMIISAAVVYMATFAILGEGSPVEVYSNVAYYASGFGASNPLDLWYASSFVPVISLLRGETFPIHSVLNSDTAKLLLMFLLTMVRSTQLIIVLAAVAIWLRPEVVPRHRAIYFAIAMAVTTSEVGGYTEILLLLFVFMERWRGVARPLAILLAYALCIPAEYVVGTKVEIVRWSWLQGSDVIAQYGLGVLALLRPLVAMLIIWCIASVTLRDVWVDIRRQGWKTRWRFRRDFPIMVGEGAARPPNASPPAQGTA